MGAGAGAAAAIDKKELSSRGLAFGKAEGELRRDVAIREERRRELEFVEKGGEALDFEFGEGVPVAWQCPPPTAPWAERSLRCVWIRDLWCLGACFCRRCAIVFVSVSDEGVGRVFQRRRGRREPEFGGRWRRRHLERTRCGGTRGCRKGRIGEISGERTGGCERDRQSHGVDLAWRASDAKAGAVGECVGGEWVGSGSQMHVKRNRARSQRVGNGHAAAKEVENAVGSDSPVADLESKTPSVSAENEAMLDVSYEALPRQSPHGLARKWSGLISSQEFEAGKEARCGPVSEQVAAADPKSREASPSQVSVQLAHGWVDASVDPDERGRASPRVASAEPVDGPTPHVQRVGELGGADGAASPKSVEDTAVVESALGKWKEEGGAVGQAGNQQLRTERKERVGVSSMEKLGDVHRVDGLTVLHGDSGAGVVGGPNVHRSAGLIKKAASSRGGNHGRLVGRDRLAQEEKRGGVHFVRVKCEDGVAENRARPCAADAEPGGQQSSGGPSCQEELRAEGQAGAVVGGMPRAMARSSSVSGSSNCKYPGAALLREKEQDPSVQADGERRRAEVQAKVNTAHDDYVLEEAENLETKRKFMEKWHCVKKCSEPARRKSHWDFVLEEMCWLAKDFFQERRWKMESAARICHSVAYERNKDEYVAVDLAKRQRNRASFLAFAVNKFWRTAEAALTKGKPGAVICGKSWTEEETGDDASEAVPMDVDVPVSREGTNKSWPCAKAEEDAFGVKRYAVNYLKVIGCGRLAQAVAPVTPDQYFECNGIPYFFDQERFAKELLYYTVPVGAMEAYRVSIEMERARAEMEYEEKRATAVAEAEAAAAADASGDASLGSGFGFSDFLVDGGSQEYEFPSNFMGEGGHARISKKKRKKIFKNSNAGRRLEGMALQGYSYQSSGMSTPDMGLQSPVVTGKRSLPGELGSNSVPGSIPVKRARSSATNLRPRASHSCISPGTAGGYPRTGLDSREPQEDEDGGMPEGCNRSDSANDIPGSKAHGVGGMGGGGFGTNKLKKKKKTKAFPGLSNSRPFEGGFSAGPAGKGGDGDCQDLVRLEQMKRKGEPSWPLPVTDSDASLGTPTDTPGTPGSQGVSGQQNAKKQKSLKQTEITSEAGTPASAFNLHASQPLACAPTASKLLKQSSMRDRNRRARPNKVPTSTPAGVGIPWSTSEDQAILALVHDLGPNWELVSDVLSSNSQIKGIFRKPKQCKERHTALTERSGADGTESVEDPSSLPSQGSKGNVKGPRVHGVPEEDSLKHLECIVQLVSKHRARKVSSDSQDQKGLAGQHPSHGIAISQFCTGGPPNPLDLCDRVTSNEDASSHSFPVQPAQGSALGPGPPMVAGSAMRPPSGGLPLLPGSSGFNLGQPSVSSSAAMSAAAARDAQRFTSRLSPEEATRLRMAAGSLSAYNARRLQQQAVSGGLPILSGLPSPSELPMLPASGNGAMLGALSRGLSLPRAGLPSMGSPVVSNMVSGGLSGMVAPAGSFGQPNMSRRTANLLGMLRVGACTEEQRLQILQQLQLQAQQGDSQAAAALLNLSSDMAAMTSSPPQPFSPQHQPLQQQQQSQQLFQQQALAQPQQQGAQHQQQQQVQNQQRNQLQQQQQQQHMQMQANPTQVYYAAAAAARMKEHQHRQQQQSLQQHQQKQRLMGAVPQAQHGLAPPHVPGLPPQQVGSQAHLLPQQAQHNGIQKPVGPQAGLGPSAPASPAGSGQSNPASLPAEQLGPSTASSRPPQGKQTQTPQSMLQHQASQRTPTGPSRGGVAQEVSSQTGQGSSFPNSESKQPANEAAEQTQQAGQKMQQASGHGQGGSASHPSGVPQSKGPVQSQAQQLQQMAQGGVPKQQQGASVHPVGQAGAAQVGAIATSIQQVQQQPSMVAGALQMQRGQASQAQQQLQQQQAQRRLQTRHLGANPLGIPMPGPLGKTGMQQTGQAASSQTAGLANHNPYQLGGGAASMGNPVGSSNPSSHGVAVNSSTMGAAPSTQWKSSQGSTPLSGGLYNLTRTNHAGGPGQVDGSALQLPSVNGSSHGKPLGGMAQGAGAGVAGAQKHGMSAGANGRAASGAAQAVPAGQRSSLANGSGMASAAGAGSGQMRPPTGGAVQGGGIGVPYSRASAAEASSLTASPTPASSGQAAPASGPPISQRPAAAAAASTASGAGGGTGSSGSSAVPSGGRGAGVAEATTPASSS